MDKLARGRQVICDPNDELPLNWKKSDPIPINVYPGFITSGPTKDGAYFVRMWIVDRRRLKKIIFDVTDKTRSTEWQAYHLKVMDSVPQEWVESALRQYCETRYVDNPEAYDAYEEAKRMMQDE